MVGTSSRNGRYQKKQKRKLETIFSKFKNDPSVISIKNEFPTAAELNIKPTTVYQVNEIIKSLDSKKTTRPDKIRVKVIKISA